MLAFSKDLAGNIGIFDTERHIFNIWIRIILR